MNIECDKRTCKNSSNHLLKHYVLVTKGSTSGKYKFIHKEEALTNHIGLVTCNFKRDSIRIVFEIMA